METIPEGLNLLYAAIAAVSALVGWVVAFWKKKK
jgi:hypothetical protein